MGVATKIGEIAKEKGIALKELSRRTGIPYTTLYNAVKRDSKIDIETVRKIAAALGTSVLELDPNACENVEIKAAGELINLIATDEVTGNFQSTNGVQDKKLIEQQLREKWIPVVASKYNISPDLLRAWFPYSEDYSVPKGWDDDAIWIETPAKQKARWAFQKIPDDWRKDTAINWQIEILKNRFKQNYNNAMFEALMQLYQDDDEYTKELAERLEGLVYNLPSTDPDKK